MWLMFLFACKPLAPIETPDDTQVVIPPDLTGTTGATGDTGLIETTPFDFSLDPLEAVNNGRFATSKVCQDCHAATVGSTAMRDISGRAVGAYDGWEASMMANATRDPLWRAFVSAEVAATPASAADIEGQCMKCHAPMRRVDAQLTGIGTPRMSDLTAGGDEMHLTLDGVSCAMCHQIEDEGLGTPESFTGGYVVNGTGTIYGPYTDPQGSTMHDATGFTPTYGVQVAKSLVCATCHTVQTRALTDDGQLNGGEVLEQAPYLEWENSRYQSGDGTCVGCHMPDTDQDQRLISTVIATNFGVDNPLLFPRSPYPRHVLVGGNTLIPTILRDNAAAMGVTAPRAAFDAVIAEARTNLQQRAAAVSVSPAYVVNGTLSFTVTVEPQTGHKFPTGIPLRRAWLRTRVIDANGALVFESGGFDVAGRIVGPDGQPLAGELAGGPQMPHVEQVVSATDVPLYEAVLKDVNGAPTYRLMRGAGYYKDNRLLPQGWSALHPNAAIVGPQGIGTDPDWTTPGDMVEFDIPVGAPALPLRVEVSMHYQTLSARVAAELFTVDTPEVAAFEEMYLRVSRAPEFVSMASTTSL